MEQDKNIKECEETTEEYSYKNFIFMDQLKKNQMSPKELSYRKYLCIVIRTMQHLMLTLEQYNNHFKLTAIPRAERNIKLLNIMDLIKENYKTDIKSDQ